MEPITCRCGARWTGVNRSHCAAKNCHVTFGGVTSFDKHREGGKCATPESLGLHDNGNGVWSATYGATNESSSTISAV